MVFGRPNAIYRIGVTLADKSGFQDTERAAGRMSSKVGGLFNKSVVPALAFGAALVGAGGAMVGLAQSASDVGESINKNTQLFGAAGKELDAWSKTTAEALGLPRVEALGLAGDFGALFESVADTKQESADMSKRLIGLSADMASFHNAAGGASEVVWAMMSGLRGESEPLRRFGVFLDEAAVNAKALEMGLAKTKKEIDNKAKITARYNLILEAAKTAQGDFARTSGDLANQTRIMFASMTDARIELGELFIPVVAKLIKSVTSELIPAFREHLVPAIQAALPFLEALMQGFIKLIAIIAKGVRFFSELWIGMDKGMRMVVVAAALLVPAIIVIPSILSAIAIAAGFAWTALGGPIGLIAVGLVALGVAAYRFRDDIKRALLSAAEFVVNGFGMVVGEVIDYVAGQFAAFVKTVTLGKVDFTKDVEEMRATFDREINKIIGKLQEWQVDSDAVVKRIAKGYEEPIPNVMMLGDEIATFVRKAEEGEKKVETATDKVAAHLKSLRDDAAKQLTEDPFSDLNKALGVVGASAQEAQAKVIAVGAAVQIAELLAQGGSFALNAIEGIQQQAVHAIQSLRSKTGGGVQSFADAILQQAGIGDSGSRAPIVGVSPSGGGGDASTAEDDDKRAELTEAQAEGRSERLASRLGLQGERRAEFLAQYMQAWKDDQELLRTDQLEFYRREETEADKVQSRWEQQLAGQEQLRGVLEDIAKMQAEEAKDIAKLAAIAAEELRMSQQAMAKTMAVSLAETSIGPGAGNIISNRVRKAGYGGSNVIAAQLASMLLSGQTEQANAYAATMGWTINDAGNGLFGFRKPNGKGDSGVLVPQLAAGGMVMKPTLAMIGEKGPEAVVPLDRMGGMGMSFNFYGPVYGREDIEDFVTESINIATARGALN